MSRYLTLATALVLLQLPAAAGAQRNRPSNHRGEALASFELTVERPGQRPFELRDDELWVEGDQSIILAVRPLDGRGRRLPEDRSWFGLELDSGCDRHVRVERLSPTRFRIESGRRFGSCEAVLWAANVPQLDRLFDLGYRGRSEGRYSAAEADEIARRLYRALLGRDGERSGVNAASQEIQRSGLESQLDAMLRSPEYRSRRTSRTADQLLDDYYRGLLERGVDREGRNEYIRQMADGDHREVLLILLRSPEFERSLR